MQDHNNPENPNNQRYKITLEYAGYAFSGWQKQKDAISVQEVVEEAIWRFSSQRVDVICAGRTDAGVNAFGQVAHFDLKKIYDTNRISNAINFFLKPHPVAIIDCQLVDSNFHARFSATSRHYLYKIFNRRIYSTIHQNSMLWIRDEIHIEKMQEAASYLIGCHDFTSFRAAGCQALSPIKTLDSMSITKKGEEIELYFIAKSFLYHMVRNMVGTLLLPAIGKIQPIQVKKDFITQG